MFAADGMRQDLIEKYTKDRSGSLPGFRRPAAQRRIGQRRRHAHPGPAEHRRRLVHDGDRRVAGGHRFDQQHLPHQHPAAWATARPPFDPGVLQAETIAQSAERGGKKVIQLEWAGGRNGAINGPTVDFRSFFSGRGVTTNFVSPSDRPPLITSFGLQYDQVTLRRRDRLDRSARVLQPGQGNPHGRRDGASMESPNDKYGLDAYIYDSTNDHRLNYDRVLFARNKNGAAAGGRPARGPSWPTSRSRSSAAPSTGRPPACWSRSRR